MSEHASQPGARPTAAPTPEQAAQMAANMLQSAVEQKHAIAQSFEAQRETVLRAVNEQRMATLEAAPSPAASSTVSGGGSTEAQSAEAEVATPPSERGGDTFAGASQGSPQPGAPGRAGGEAQEHAFAGIDSETLKTLLSLTDPRTATALEQSLVMGQIVRSLRRLIGREVRAQLAAAGIAVAPASDRPAGANDTDSYNTNIAELNSQPAV